jgi:hypothetical protein
MDRILQDKGQPQAPAHHPVCRVLLTVERQRIDFVLPQPRVGQHWLHVLGNTEFDQRLASDLGTRHKLFLCSHGQQVWATNSFLDFDGCCPSHLC